jgi:cysteinyl-tRNA synthetase
MHALRQLSRSAATEAEKTNALFQLYYDAKFLGFDLGEFRRRHTERQQLDALQHAVVSTLIDERNAARKARNFKEADRIRNDLLTQGVELEDRKDGTTTWRVKR